MEIVIGIVSVVVTIISLYIGYLQLKRTPLPKRTEESKELPETTVGPVRERSLSEGRASLSNMRSFITALLPADLHQMFNYNEYTATTEEDMAGLSLIAEVIEKEARSEIRVIGRGTQLEEERTRDYVRAVANAILRGVAYKRILIIDPALPQNALLWLLLIERFLGSARWRDSVCLYVSVQSTNMGSNYNTQFQIVDGMFLHDVTRNYPEPYSRASKRAYSLFALSPAEEVSDRCKRYQTHLMNAGNRYKHYDVVNLLTEMLNKLDPKKHDIMYHWQLVLKVVDFLESLNISNLPPSHIKFVGCLMPFTFTYEAAGRFVKDVNQDARGERVITLPFRRMEDAIKQFLEKRLDYLCVPVENSSIDNLMPPTTDELLLEALRKASHQVYEAALPVRFVLAGVYQKPTKWKQLAAVDAAYLQVKERLPRNANRLARREEEVESNYHAAWLARRDPTLLAVTTSQAAKFFELHRYSDLRPVSESNTTKFVVYSHKT